MRKSENEYDDHHQELHRNARKFIGVDKILIPKDKDDELDGTLVSELAESFKLSSQLEPILVRRLKRPEHGKKYVLIAGAHRLEALKYNGAQKADCIVVEGNETQARLAAVAENLWRKNLTVLQRAELLKQYYEIMREKVSGQLVRKPGRPPAGIAAVGRALPAIARSEEARRKILSRALKVAALTPEAKSKAKEAGLDNNERALLTIAKASNRKAQLKKIAELTQGGGMPKVVSRSAAATNQSGNPKIQQPNKPPGSNRGQAPETSNVAGSQQQETSLDQLEKFWDGGGRALWAYTRFETRERFLNELRRAKCKATVDVCKFIKDVLYGRRKVEKQQLYALAAAKGISKKALRDVIQGWGIKSKRVGQRHETIWYFMNPDRDWKEGIPLIKDQELKEALDSEQERVAPKPQDSEDSHRIDDDLDDSINSDL